MHVEEGPVVEMDRWHVSVWKNPNVSGQIGTVTESGHLFQRLSPFPPLTLPLPFLLQAHEPEGQEDVPLHVINNYFSVGCDAQVSLDFHLERGTTTTMKILNIIRIYYRGGGC